MGLNKTQQRWVKNAALASGYAYPLLAALVDKESNGQFTWKVDGKNRLALNIEPHRFYKYIGLMAPNKLKEAVASGLASKKRGAIKVPGSYSGRYAMLERMKALHVEAAYQSVSFGVGQIMGENYDEMGYASAEHMFAAADVGGGQAQVEQIIQFIATKPQLVTAMHDEDTKQIAYYYNGPAYRENKYDTELDRLILVYSGEAPITAPEAISDLAERRAIELLGYASVEQFQTENGLEPDGVIGAITKAKISEVQAARKAAKNKPAKTAGTVVAGTTATVGGAVIVAENAETITDTIDKVEPVITAVQRASSFGPTIAIVVVVALILGVTAYVIWKRTRSTAA